MIRIRRWRDWPWAGKLAALMVAIVLVPIAIMTWVTELTARYELIRDSRRRNLQQATNTAALLNRYLEDAAGDVTILALSPAGVAACTTGTAADFERLAVLMRGIQETKHMQLLQIIDRDGTVIAATDPARVGADRITAPFFLSAMAGQTRVHDPRFVPDDRQIHINISAPVHDARDRIVGVAAARISLDDIDRLAAVDTDYGGLGEYGMLWDAQGIVLSSPAHPERQFRPLAPLLPYSRNQLAAEGRFGPDTGRLLSAAGTGEALVLRSRWRLYDPSASPHVTTSLDDGPLQVTMVPVPQTRWTYAIATPEGAAMAIIRAESSRNIAVALLTSIVAILLSLVAARWVSSPLAQVGDAARALAAGDMTRRARLHRRDEIGALADTFDAMAEALAAKDAELREHADSLERRVEERTAEVTGLLRAVPDLIFKVSADGRLADYVPAKGKELGLPPEQFLGRPISDVLPHEVSPGAVERIWRALAGEEVPPYEYKLSVAGEERHYEARISPSSQGAVVVVVRDITERRRGEERARFLARAAAAMSSSLDYGSTVETLANLAVPFLADLCLVDLLEHGQVRCGAVAADSPDRQALALAIRLKYPVPADGDHPVAIALRGGTTLYADCTPETLQALRPSEEHASTAEAIGLRSLLVLPLSARGQTFGALTLVSSDPARRYTQADVALASELAGRAGIALDNARLYREVQESNRLKDEFLGTVSHELRTPLNAVLGWAQVLKRTASEPAQTARALEAIERNAQAQAQLVEDLLDTSRVVSGKLHVNFVPVDLGEIVHIAVESFRPIAKAGGVELTMRLGDGLVPILADSARLQQVIGNVLSNALKFTPIGGRVSVAVRRSGETMEIVVADTGRGIAPEFLPFVFDRFRQGDSTTTRVHGGLGLGLSIARHLVVLHGGTIRAESAGEQQGATFTIVLPVKPAEAVPQKPRRAAAPAVLSGIRVLVVDDQEDARALMAAVLGAAAAQVDTVGSAEDARRRVAARRPDVLVADIGMPGEDGYSLIRSIRRSDEAAGRPRLPSIAVTAYAREDDRLRALTAGYDRHLTKPLDPGTLLDTIAELTMSRGDG
jgi:PAS domain S-box-containing protein